MPIFQLLGKETTCQVFQDRLENVRERLPDARCEPQNAMLFPLLLQMLLLFALAD
jgi:hypothetical protein